jgi:hypothetical protein
MCDRRGVREDVRRAQRMVVTRRHGRWLGGPDRGDDAEVGLRVVQL